ncbi:MAG: cation-translocating P-type ATPase [Clostridia bacterium]|nr:cation-translocating P-type ATPase [Clostridia bacterium]
MEGLTSKQVKQRQETNQVNYDTTVPTKSIKKIIYDNFFTLFNIINLLLGIAIFLVGSYKNMLFLGIIIINTAISTIQEIHSKKIVDKLSIMASSVVKVIRDGKKQEISIYELVIDDVVEFQTGSQIPTDSILLEGDVQVNESFITGESDSIYKKNGDMLLSGSYIVSGKCIAKVEHVGEENYTAKISSGAKYVKKINSEIMNSLGKIIKFLTFAIIPIGIGLFYTQLQIDDTTFQEAVVKSVAGIIGMIPEGLVLLTSTVLAVSVIRLSKQKVLVQELYCIETLARVDTLCLDKTGTLTEGVMEVKDFVPVNQTKEQMANVLANLAIASEDENATIEAIRSYFTKVEKQWKPLQKYAFSSQTKWSGIGFEGEGTYLLGAPEFIVKSNFDQYKETITQYAKDYRVLVVAYTKEEIKDHTLPENVELIGYVLVLDKIRKEAKQTLQYFEKQGVDIKIISGDNPITVSKIAKQVGVKNYEQYIDMTTLQNEEEIKEVALKYTIFGRVSPNQKKLLVQAMQKANKTVAMTGDGVNDVLALKTADCSIAMANGSDATKAVSQLILLDSNFSSMPKVVAEGRRTINNIQRSATLFLVKTIYSGLLAIMFLFMGEAYPFIPIQMSLIGTITIGLPSFILALEPNHERIKGEFLKNVIVRALPTGLTVILNIFVLAILNKKGILLEEQYSSLCVIGTGVCGIILLFTLAKTRKEEHSKLPVSVFRLSLAIVVTLLFLIGLTTFNWWFNIAPLKPILNFIIRIVVISIVNFTILTMILKKILFKNEES